MAQLNISIPEELKEEIEHLGNSSLLVRKLLMKELQESQELKSIILKSELTEDDVQELTDKVEISLTEKFEASLNNDQK